MKNQEQNFQIAPEPAVGTEILEPNMPSNLDFQESSQGQELKQIKKESLPPQPIALPQSNNIALKSYTIKGKTIFMLPPKYPAGSVAPLTVPTTPIRDLNKQERKQGIWGFWQKVVGYSKREISIEEGYIYIFSREKEGLKSLAAWRLVDLFKIFVDMQQLQLRIVAKTEGSSQLISRDFQSIHLKSILALLNEQLNAIGLTMI